MRATTDSDGRRRCRLCACELQDGARIRSAPARTHDAPRTITIGVASSRVGNVGYYRRSETRVKRLMGRCIRTAKCSLLSFSIRPTSTASGGRNIERLMECHRCTRLDCSRDFATIGPAFYSGKRRIASCVLCHQPCASPFRFA
jgi:hypothetical protein